MSPAPAPALVNRPRRSRCHGAGVDGIYTFQSNSLSLQVTQQIYSGGHTVAQTRQAIETVQSTRAQTLAVETTVLQSVAQAYLDVVRDQALVEVNRNNVKVLREQLTPPRTASGSAK